MHAVHKIPDVQLKHFNAVQAVIALVGILCVTVDPIAVMHPMNYAHYQNHVTVTVKNGPHAQSNRLNVKKAVFVYQKLLYAMANDNAQMVKMKGIAIQWKAAGEQSIAFMIIMHAACRI